MLNTIASNPLVNLGGFIFGVLGVVLAVIFYFRGRQVLGLKYEAKSFDLITAKISQLPGFAATYKNRPLENLTASRLAIWNSGTTVVSAENIAPNDKIRISLPEDAEFLNATVTFASSLATNVTVSLEGSRHEAIVHFDYLSPRDGCVISFLHTGKADSVPSMLGSVKGFGSPRLYKLTWPIKVLDIIVPLFAAYSGESGQSN